MKLSKNQITFRVKLTCLALFDAQMCHMFVSILQINVINNLKLPISGLAIFKKMKRGISTNYELT